MVLPGGVATPVGAGLGGELGGGLVVVGQGVSHDGGGHLQQVLAQGGAAGGVGGDPDRLQQPAEVLGAQRLAGLAAGKSQAESGFDAVRMPRIRIRCNWRQFSYSG